MATSLSVAVAAPTLPKLRAAEALLVTYVPRV